jgi:serine/threonine protein phosphatase PrpC
LENGELKLLSPPDNGEFINETYFVTSSSYKTRFRIFKGELDQICGFILMSDGTCESLFDKKNRKVAPILLTLLNWLDNFPIEEVNIALTENFEKVIKRKTTDDCSIGLMKLSIHSFIIDENELIKE